MPENMRLKVLLPYRVFADEKDVLRIVVETGNGSFGLWPRRLDCVAAIVPGILIYQGGAEERYVAVDAGVLVKTGAAVYISVRHAIAGVDLDQLHNTVEQKFLQQSTQEIKVRSVFQKMESDFIRRLVAFHQDS